MSNQVAVGSNSREGVKLAMTTLLAGAPLSGAKLHLYKSPFVPNPSSVAADFQAQEATFTGYAPVALTWSAIGLDDAGNPSALSIRAFFQATDAAAPNVVGGCWLEYDVAGPPIVDTAVEYYQFQTPVNMAVALAFVGVVVATQLPGGPGYAIIDS